MLTGDRLRGALEGTTGVQIQRACFRIVELGALLAGPGPVLLYDEGPSRYGQRFSPPGDHRGLYLAESRDTAGCEYAGGRKEWQEGRGDSFAVLQVDVCLKSVLDLTDIKIRRGLKTTLSEIQSAWLGHFEILGSWPPTWELGHHAFASGRFDAIRYPSTKDRAGACLLVFTQQLERHSGHVVIHQRDGSVWERIPPLYERQS